MFEHIYFLSDQVNVESKELRQLKKYDEMVKDYGLAADADFHIEGRSQYLLPHPMTLEKQKHLMFLQGFAYADSGAAYYTKRKTIIPTYCCIRMRAWGNWSTGIRSTCFIKETDF